MKRNRISLRESLYTLSLLLLMVALFGIGFIGNVTRVHAQSDAACGTADTDQLQDENTANDATEPKCPENNQEKLIA